LTQLFGEILDALMSFVLTASGSERTGIKIKFSEVVEKQDAECGGSIRFPEAATRSLLQLCPRSTSCDQVIRRLT